MGSHKSKYHFCYLLQSLNEQFPHSTYIGYTVNPKRRIRQHNREVRILIFNIHIQIANGAYKTHKARPWEMIVVVTGFPTHKEALSFVWACLNAIELSC